MRLILQGDSRAATSGKMVRWGARAYAAGGVRHERHTEHWRLYVSSVVARCRNPSHRSSLASIRILNSGRGYFCVIGVAPDKITFSIFMWLPPQPVAVIDTMKPVLSYEVRARPSSQLV